MIYDYYKEINKKLLGSRIFKIAILLVLLVVAGVLLGIYTDIIQLDEIGGLSSIYITNLIYRLSFFFGGLILIFLAIFITIRIIRKNAIRYTEENDLELMKLPNTPIALIFSAIGASIGSRDIYLKALSFLNSTPFGRVDPIFGKDIGYYVFDRPFFMALYGFVTSLWLFVIVFTVAYYALILLTLLGRITWKDLNIESILRHNLINIAIFFLIKTLSYKFVKEGILYSNIVNLNGVAISGAGYTEAHIWMTYFNIAPWMLAAIVLAALFFIWKGRLKHAAYATGIYPAVWLVISIAATLIQTVYVKPNEILLENKYLSYNMENTRAAYGIDDINTISFSGIKELSGEVLSRNQDTVGNVRIIDFKPTLDNNIQLQSIKNFYTFNDGDIINYNLNGQETPVFISAREIDKNKLLEKSYINTLFNYTHGYGVVINPINKVTNEGQVDFILGSLKMSGNNNLKVTEPRIYYGELTRDHVIVNPPNSGKLKEIDYDGSTEVSYNGKGGIKLSLLNRLIFAFKYQDIQMLMTSNINSDSKLLLNREILDRVGRAVPFLTIDKDPYIILTKEGRLLWVIDAYTTTADHPYSQTHGNFNYIRNSVKITVDAYNGDVKYHIIDSEDPIIATYNKMYPGIFSSDPLPDDLKEHSRYPEFIFRVQTDMLERYHLDPAKDSSNISKFYSNQDLWDVARNPAGADTKSAMTYTSSTNADIEPYYNLIRLPKVGSKEEMVLMRPFTTANKHNMAAWLAVRNSAESYGDLVLYTFPDDTNVLGPYQVEANINSIDKVSKDMTLWGQSGSRVFKGSLLVIPIEDSILYVEPIYIQSSGASSIPQVRELVVGFQRGEDFKYGVGANLTEALNNMLVNAGASGGVGATTAAGSSATSSQGGATSSGTAGSSGSTTSSGTAVTAMPSPGSAPATSTGPANQGTAGNDPLLNEIITKYDDLRKQLDELDKLMQELRKK